MISKFPQREKISPAYNDLINVIPRIAEGSGLGPFLFKIFINNTFLVEMLDTSNIAVANTLYSYYSNLPFILDNLERDMKNYLYWFKSNSLKAN